MCVYNYSPCILAFTRTISKLFEADEFIKIALLNAPNLLVGSISILAFAVLCGKIIFAKVNVIQLQETSTFPMLIGLSPSFLKVRYLVYILRLLFFIFPKSIILGSMVRMDVFVLTDLSFLVACIAPVCLSERQAITIPNKANSKILYVLIIIGDCFFAKIIDKRMHTKEMVLKNIKHSSFCILLLMPRKRKKESKQQ